MPTLTKDPKESRFTVNATSGIMPDGTRQEPYLSVISTGNCCFSMHPDTDRDTPAVIRALADDLEKYWADWDAYNNAKDPSGNLPLED